MEYSKFLDDLITTAAKENASDLHLAVGRHPILRVAGALLPLTNLALLTPDDTAGLVESMIGKEKFKEFLVKKDYDFSYAFKDKIRFRVNIYFQKGYIGAALRAIPVKIRTVQDLMLPETLLEFTRKEQGFFLVVGPTGHGKSTTLAALVDEINHSRAQRIITIEDPIEYI